MKTFFQYAGVNKCRPARHTENRIRPPDERVRGAILLTPKDLLGENQEITKRLRPTDPSAEHAGRALRPNGLLTKLAKNLLTVRKEQTR